jgi:uncharacterized iron-regulated protein
MIRKVEVLFPSFLAFFLFAAIGYGSDYPVYSDAQSYILEKLKTHDIVLLGTTHKKPAILQFLSELIPVLYEADITHIGLEIASHQQTQIDNFMRTQKKLSDIKIHTQIDCPEYRNLLIKLGSLDPNTKPKIIALDLPKSQYQGHISRDEWMARSITRVFSGNPEAKMLVVVGNLHVLKVLNWQGHVPNKHGSISEYLNSMMPEIRVFSISQLIDENPRECDFTREFGSDHGSVAMDCDGRFRGWKFGPASCIAIRCADPCDLVDGIIVY